MAGRLEGKTAIITGAGMGLGEGITRKFVEEGANVLLFEISAEHGQKVADSLPKEKAAFFKGDVTKVEDWQAALKEAQEKFGSLDIVVNNAGVVHNAAV
jgi:3-oxoacyl-[acyl-carrier protein] reductase